MKKLIMLAVLLVAGAVFAQQTQDLGEISKKEKERREALAREGKKAKVYTAEDLERVKDKLGMETTSEGTTEEGEPAEGQVPEAPAEETASSTGADSEKEGIESELKQLREQRDELQREVEEARGTLNQGGGGAMTINPAVEHQQVRESQAKMQELDKKIRELESKLSDVEKKQAEKAEAEEKKE